MENIIRLTVHHKDGSTAAVGYVCESVYNAGYAGKDQELVRGHIEELARLGVPAPSETPTLYPLSNYVLTSSGEIQVQHGETSGEAEFVLLMQDGRVYVTAASDHTDRKLENFSVPISKQACPNVIAPDVWLYDDVKDHWDSLMLRCWVVKDGTRALYQEAPLSALLSPEEWSSIWDRVGMKTQNCAFLSGTINTLGGLVFGEEYELSLTDPVLNREIRHSYKVEVLPEGIE